MPIRNLNEILGNKFTANVGNILKSSLYPLERQPHNLGEIQGMRQVSLFLDVLSMNLIGSYC